jgi:AcrR family transcriptional regulator
MRPTSSAESHALGRSRAYLATREEDAGRAPRSVTPADAFRAALRAFVREPRLDMGRLAAELGIAKATLYRWTGTREQLLAEVLAYFSEDAFDQALEATKDFEGAPRVIACVRGYLEGIVSFAPLRRFVQTETPLAIRILTARGGAPQASAVRRIADLLEQEQQRGLNLRAPVERLAYAITRMGEAFIYNEAISEVESDIDTAIDMIRLLVE